MDYKELCLELFGTNDVEELRKIADEIRKNNPRGAGRKRKITEEQILYVRKALSAGKSLSELANELDTSIQVLGRYLATPIRQGCTMRIEYMFRNKICSVIDVDFSNEKIYLENRTDILIHRAFGINENPDWNDFMYFIKDRCFEEGRADIKPILKQMQLNEYDPLAIAEATDGRTAEDNMWMRFTYKEKAS